ncbi:MAG: class I SAM-dependent methyltransferase [Rhodothermaceae bacterium]
MYKYLSSFNKKEPVYTDYTTIEMWNDPHISKQMLKFHLNPDVALASRTKEFIDDSVNWMINKFDIKPGIKICDFGCGPGLYTQRFAKTGADITGIDVSENSINYAQKISGDNNLNIKYINQNYLVFTPKEKYDLIIMVFCDFCVLNLPQRKQLLKTFSNSLKPGGKLLLDIFSEKFYADTSEELNYEYNPDGGFWSENSYHLFSKTFKYEEEKTVLMKFSVIEENGSRLFYNYLKSFNKKNLTEEFTKNGFCNFEFFANVKGDSFSEDQDTICMVCEKI